MRKSAIVFLLMFVSAVCFAGEQKIAVVDMSMLLKAHPETTRAESVLEEQVKEIEAEKDKLTAGLEKLRDEVDNLVKQSQNKALSDKNREKFREQAEEKYKDLRKMDLDAKKAMDSRRQDLNEQRMIMHKRIVETITETVSAYAKDKRIGFVLDKGAVGISGMPVLVFAEPGVDITAEIEKIIVKK